MIDWQNVKVYRCRWCGRRVSGVFGWFHNPDKCSQQPDGGGWKSVLEDW